VSPDRPPARPRRRRGPRLRLGLRNEVLILLPAALVLLVILSTFTLLSYRSALTRLSEERRDEAVRQAGNVAAALAAAPGAPLLRLQPLAPGARGIAVLDDAGRLAAIAGGAGGAAVVGEPPANPMAATGGRSLGQPFGVGPEADLPDAVAGFSPLPGGGAVRVELPAATLAGQRRAIGLLTVVVLAVNGALLVLVVVFLRHLLAPYETLLERARQAGELPAADGGDEIDLLLSTFERALSALAVRAPARPPGEAGEDDIAALERTLSASLQSGLLLVDREGRVLALNEVGAVLLSTPAPAPGTPLGELLAAQPELLALLAAAIDQEREVNRQECTLRSAPAEEGRAPDRITLGLTVHPLRRAGHAVRGYLVLFADLTGARRKAEESRLAEGLAQLGEMAAGVAHELRNSLATLSGYLTLLERGPDASAAADYRAELRHETDHLARVVDDFLAFARPGTARPEELVLGRLLRRAAVDPALDGLPVEVAAELDEVHLHGDPQLLERAFGNLLRNAAQAERAAGRSGPVEVGLEAPAPGSEPAAPGVEVTIADRGPGVPPEIQERLFQPFATGRPEGVGLGLAVAQRVINLHGGQVRLVDRPGGGTEARISFPAARRLEPDAEHERYPS
jgi:signal transduction histidine kinase